MTIPFFLLLLITIFCSCNTHSDRVKSSVASPPAHWEQEYVWSFDTVAYYVSIDELRKIEFTEMIRVNVGEEKRCDTLYGKPIYIVGKDTFSLNSDLEFVGCHIISPDKQKVAFLTRRCSWMGNVWIDRESCYILDSKKLMLTEAECSDGNFDKNSRWACDSEEWNWCCY